MISQWVNSIRCYCSATRFVWMLRPLVRLNVRSVPYYLRGSACPVWLLIAMPFLVGMLFLVRKVHKRFNLRAIAAMVVISEIMFIFWVHYAVMNGHWVYNEARILGPRFWGIPIEEPLIYYWAPQIFVVATMLYIHTKLRKSKRRVLNAAEGN
jgi:lycopene cyclase domain-containing protein